MGMIVIVIVIGRAGDIVRPGLEVVIVTSYGEAGAVADVRVVVGKGQEWG